MIEVYADAARQKPAAPGTRFAFVTHNTKDFSHPTGSQKYRTRISPAVFRV